MARVLVVDDETSVRNSLARLLENAGYETATAGTAPEALALLSELDVDVVLTDIVLPRTSGVELLRAIRARRPGVEVVMMTGEPTLDTATAAIRLGAFDYLPKPVGKDALIKTVHSAERVKALADEKRRLEEENGRHQEELEVLVEERTRALREAEEQLRQTQKMEAVGQLAAGVAHDFNNMLMGMMACAEFIKEDVPTDSPAAEDAEVLLVTARRATELTRQLLMFSRQHPTSPEVLSLNHVVNGLASMLKRLMREDVSHEFRLTDDVRCVRVDPGHIEQLLVNLAINAGDAMPAGGRLRIETANVTLCDEDSRRFVEASGPVAGDYVVLTVADTGCGISEEARSRIFEPFFTTKERGQGTGIGLAAVYGISKEHGAHIQLESTVGRGTVFRIYFPCVEGHESASSEGGTGGTARGGTETVLLVEDEDLARKAQARMLRGLGYTVIEAASGEDALRVAAVTRPDVLLADVILPGIDGVTLSRELCGANPGLRTILTSGYPESKLDRFDLPRGDVALVRKPFGKAQIAGKIREVIEA